MDIYKILEFLGRLTGFIVNNEPKRWSLARLFGLKPPEKKQRKVHN